MDCLDIDLIRDETTFNLTSAGIEENEIDQNTPEADEGVLNGIFSEGNVLREYKIDIHRRFNRSIDLCYSKLTEYSGNKQVLSPCHIVVQRNRVKTLNNYRYKPCDIDFRSFSTARQRKSTLQNAGKFSFTIKNGTNKPQTPLEENIATRNFKRVKFMENPTTNCISRLFNFDEVMEERKNGIINIK